MPMTAEIDGQTYEFPDGTTPEEMQQALSSLPAPFVSKTTATAEQFTDPTPAFDLRLNGGGPSVGGALQNAASGGAKMLRGFLTSLADRSQASPDQRALGTATAGGMLRGVLRRGQQYAEAPLETIYDDPTAFGLDALGAYAGLKAGAPTARHIGPAIGKGADIAAHGAIRAASKLPIVGPVGKGFVEGAQARATALRPPPPPASAVPEMAAGYDRYLPNVSPERAIAQQVAEQVVSGVITEAEAPSMFARALQEMRSGSLNRVQSVMPRGGR